MKCSKAENIQRSIKDGRDEARIKRGVEKTFSYYDNFDYPSVDTTNLIPSEAAWRIVCLTNLNCRKGNINDDWIDSCSFKK